jgi:hypothetical protein
MRDLKIKTIAEKANAYQEGSSGKHEAFNDGFISGYRAATNIKHTIWYVVEDCPFVLVEKFTDNGMHDHWELAEKETGNILWSNEDYLKNKKSEYSDFSCPFCKDAGFDVIGLKHHLKWYCEIYNKTETL